MKKTILFVALFATLFLVGCQSGDGQDWLSQSNSYESIIQDPLPSRTIEIPNLEKFNEMKQIAECDDEKRLEQYILSISNSGIQSRNDLLSFVKLIDSLPHIPISGKSISLIRFSRSTAQDTGKETIAVHILSEVTNGDWARVEYVLSVVDVSGKIAEEKALIDKSSTLLSPVKTADGSLTLHIETRNPHPSGKGTMIRWTGEVAGIFMRIYYYTENAGDIKAEQLFGSMVVDNFANEGK